MKRRGFLGVLVGAAVAPLAAAKVAAESKTVAAFPEGESLAPFWAVKDSDAAGGEIQIDWWRTAPAEDSIYATFEESRKKNLEQAVKAFERDFWEPPPTSPCCMGIEYYLTPRRRSDD